MAGPGGRAGRGGGRGGRRGQGAGGRSPSLTLLEITDTYMIIFKLQLHVHLSIDYVHKRYILKKFTMATAGAVSDEGYQVSSCGTLRRGS